MPGVDNYLDELAQHLAKGYLRSFEIGLGRGSVVVLLIDEADAIAQSREMAEMHHEDRAGVNAVIRGVDRFSNQRLPVLTVLCSNRADSIDQAIQRRAARTFVFTRPDPEQRREVIFRALEGTGADPADLDELIDLTGERDGRDYGYTYSDLTIRLLPDAVISAYPDQPLRVACLVELAKQIIPTPPFGDSAA